MSVNATSASGRSNQSNLVSEETQLLSAGKWDIEIINKDNNYSTMVNNASQQYRSVNTLDDEVAGSYVPPSSTSVAPQTPQLLHPERLQYRPASIALHRNVEADQLQFQLEGEEIPALPISGHVADPNASNQSDDDSFMKAFLQSNGPPQIVLLICILAIGFGSIIGVVPAVMTDRYARNHYGYDGVEDCAVAKPKPLACIEGSGDAQNAAAIENLVSNILTFTTSSLLGSISDMYGRRNILILSMMVCTIRPIVLVGIQTYPTMNPGWYYAASALNGLFNWIAIALSSMSDVMPTKWRAPSFGLLIAGFLMGIAVAPQLAIVLGHYNVSLLSLGMVGIGLLLTIFFLPETLSQESSSIAKQQYKERVQHLTTPTEKFMSYLCRPLLELTILNRNRLFRLLTMLAFCSSFVSSGDQTLVVYYIQERIGFNDSDVANFFMVLGILGIFMQGFVLKHANSFFGERQLLMLCFSLGAIHNAWYGFSHTKSSIFLAAAVGTVGAMAFPTISAIKANNVESSEQGRIQGALYSISAIASAIGPMGMRFIYHYTKDGAWFGAGSMFIGASFVNWLAVYFAYLLPDEANSRKRKIGGGNGNTTAESVTSDEETVLLDTAENPATSAA